MKNEKLNLKIQNNEGGDGILLKKTINNINAPSLKAAKEAQARLDSLTKPQGSLGRLEELAKQVASITGKLNPDLSKKIIIVMAADHGVVKEGVSAYPQEVTPQMVYNFLDGGAAINVLAGYIGADVAVVDAGIATDMKHKSIQPVEDKDPVSLTGPAQEKNKNKTTSGIFFDKKIDSGTKNIADGAAMTQLQAIKSIEAGISTAIMMIEKGYGIIGTGDMGIGNTTASSAIAASICKAEPELVTGFGTGVDDTGYSRKVQAIIKAIGINKPNPDDGLDVLSKVGGFEIGAIAGIILGCASKKIPVVIDGFISGAAALIAEKLAPGCRDYMIASHCSVEKGHKIILGKLDIKPLFDFDMRLGEGTGAAIGISIVEAALKVLNEMATFDEAKVSKKTS